MGWFRKHWGATPLGLLLVAALPAHAAEAPADAALRARLADRLAEEARTRTRDSRLPAELATREALILLQTAHDVAPQAADPLRLLAEAAEAAGQEDVARDALRQLVALDPGNLVAQARYLDLLARSKDTLDEQLRIYRSAADSQGLDPQVRSEMALRLARLLAQRGQKTEALDALRQAVALNSVNVTAWLEMLPLLPPEAAENERLGILEQALLGNPYQPKVWSAGGNLLAANGCPAAAADWWRIALEQSAQAGLAAPPDLLLDYAAALALADRRAELTALLRGWLQEKPPAVPVLLLAYWLGPTATTQPADAQRTQLQQRFADAIAAAPDQPQPLADALWFDLLESPDLPATVAPRLAKLAQLLPADDPLLQRLRAAEAWRKGDAKQAETTLTPLAGQDFHAAYLLAKVLEKTKPEQAKALLADAWQRHPAGLMAVQVWALARQLQAPLPADPQAAALTALAERVPLTLRNAHRQPRDLVLTTASLARARIAYGDLAQLNVTLHNASNYPLAVGPGTAVSSNLAATATVLGDTPRDLGAAAFESTARVFRLEPHANLPIAFRIDQGPLAAALQAEPARAVDVALNLVTEPQIAGTRVVPGLGGQHLLLERLHRSELWSDAGSGLRTARQQWPSLTIDQQALTLQAAGRLPNDPASPPPWAAEVQALFAAPTDSPLLAAWALLVQPEGTPVRDAALTAADPTVRLAACLRLAGQSDRAAARERLRRIAAEDAAPRLRAWAGALREETARPPASSTVPAASSAASTATAPSTAPAKR